MDLLKEIEKYWRQHQLQVPGGTVVAGCSGGIDSLALLDALWRLQARLQIRVVAAHFEHGIRGEASLADAEFVRGFCTARQITYYQTGVDVPQAAKAAGESLETAARRLRYDFFRKICQEYPGAVIATAHHQDDQAETILMHLIRGCGISGLAGIRPKQADIIRPVLFACKSDLAAYCKEQQLTPRHDATNDVADCFRNRLRLQLLPQLKEQYNPALVQSLCQLGELAGADEDMLQQLTARKMAQIVRPLLSTRGEAAGQAIGYSCQVAELLKQPLAMQRRLLQSMVKRLAGEQLSFVHIEAMLELCRQGRTGTRLQLAFGLESRISYGIFYLQKNTISFLENDGTIETAGDIFPIVVKIPGITRLPTGEVITAKLSDKPLELAADGKLMIYGDLDKCSAPLLLRHRQPGDKVNLGFGHKKLKDFLIDSHIPQQKRDKLWLLVSGERVLWVPGLRRFVEAMADRDTKRYFYLNLQEKESR